jgi:hypothetical protein
MINQEGVKVYTKSGEIEMDQIQNNLLTYAVVREYAKGQLNSPTLEFHYDCVHTYTYIAVGL